MILCLFLDRLLNAKSDEERDIVNELRHQHRTLVSYTRERTTHLMDLAINHSDLFLFVAMDGMDSNKTQVPWLRSDAVYSKDLENTGKTYDTRLVGMHVPMHGFYGWWVEPLYKQGGSGTCSLLHRLFCDLLDRNKRLPRVLVLMLDNTVKENKNNQVVQYLALLVHKGVFDRIVVVFLLVGHTHSIIDQRFSVIHRALSTNDAFTLTDLVTLTKDLTLKDGKTNVRYNQQKVVKQSLDFGWLANFSYSFKGFQTTRIDGEKHTAHSLQLFRDQGTVKLAYKDLDVPGPWLGHYVTNNPFEVFKSPPVIPSHIKVMPRRQVTVAPIKEKVEAMLEFIGSSDSVAPARQWWEGLFKREAEFWDDLEVDNGQHTANVVDGKKVEAPQVVDGSDPHLRSWLPVVDGVVWCQPIDEVASAVALELLKEHDQLPLPEGLLVPEQQRWIGRHGVKDDLPRSLDTFDPLKDLAEGMIALVNMDQAASSLQRGWELAYVSGVRDFDGEKVFDGVYLCPKVPGRKASRVASQEDWPQAWEKLPLVQMLSPQGKVWDFEGIEVEHVQWASEPSGGARLGKALRVGVKPSDRAFLLRSISLSEEAATRMVQASEAARAAAEAAKRQRAVVTRELRSRLMSDDADNIGVVDDDGVCSD